MSDPLTQEPTRLLDEPDIDPILREDLELARAHPPIAYSVDAGLARFEQAIHGASTVPAGGTLIGARVLGWFIGAVALIGGGALALGLADDAEPDLVHAQARVHAGASEASGASQTVRAEEPPVTARSSAARDVPGGARARESVVEAGALGRAEDAGAAAQAEDAGAAAQAEGDGPPLAEPSPPRPASKARARAPEPGGSLADEAAQINAARKALARDPGEALALMEAAEHEFPAGAMVQERRGYAILALVALGRTAEASQRADAYLERWPNGPLSGRIRDALGR